MKPARATLLLAFVFFQYFYAVTETRDVPSNAFILRRIHNHPQSYNRHQNKPAQVRFEWLAFKEKGDMSLIDEMLLGVFMARITVEDCLEVIDNRFAMVLLAAARTRQLMKGSRPLVDGYKNNEQVTALREIAAKKVRFDKEVKKVLESSLSDLSKEYDLKHSQRV